MDNKLLAVAGGQQPADIVIKNGKIVNVLTPCSKRAGENRKNEEGRCGMDNKLLAVAGGQQPADIVIKNGKIVNVLTAEIYDGGVAIVDQTIAAVGDVDYCIGEGTQVVDAQGMFITPGFIDGHIHPESSDLAIRSFAEGVLKHGTTSIMTDLHEVGVVSGIEGIEAVLGHIHPESSDLAIRSFAEGVLKHGTTSIMTDLHEVGVVSGIEGIEAVLKENEATDLNLYFVVPSHVPFSPALETSGGSFNPEIIRKALQREDAVGISECVGPYILAGFPDLMESLDDVAGMKGMTAQGHLVEMKGADLNKCVAAGVSTCHEALSADDIMDRARVGVHAMLRESRARVGVHAMLRESSAARTLVQQLECIVGKDIDTSMMSIVTDDLHTCDLAETGHLDHHLKLALGAGLPFVKAIQMVTVNAARAFELTDIGALAPGKRADINIVAGDTADTFGVVSTWSRGKQVLDNGEMLVHYEPAEHDPCLLNTRTPPALSSSPTSAHLLPASARISTSSQSTPPIRSASFPRGRAASRFSTTARCGVITRPPSLIPAC